MTCTVIANVPDLRNTAHVRWTRNNDIMVKSVIVSSTPVNNYTYMYPLTIRNISLSDAGEYSCTATMQSNDVLHLLNSDSVADGTTINVNCKFYA